MREEETIARVRYVLMNIFSIKDDVFLCVICIIVGRSFGAIRNNMIFCVYTGGACFHNKERYLMLAIILLPKNERQVSLIS